MANILPENETFTFEDREYVNPQVSLDEQNAFIDNLRQTQQQNTGEIVQQTRNLGTEVPSNLGGLVGGEGYWTSRYQTPQTNAVVSQLRSAAQAQALNDVLANEQAKWKKRYNDAYRAYQKRGAGGGGGNDDDPDDDNSDGEVDETVVSSQQFFDVPDTNFKFDENEDMLLDVSFGSDGNTLWPNVKITKGVYTYTDPGTGKEYKLSKEYFDKLYGDSGKLTDDGAVILDVRNMLGI